jgi:hypothetical protein
MSTALEEAYQRIGWWKGSRFPREFRAESHAFWKSVDEQAIGWLVMTSRLKPQACRQSRPGSDARS